MRILTISVLYCGITILSFEIGLGILLLYVLLMCLLISWDKNFL